MNLITGHFKHTRKGGGADWGTISEVYVSDVLGHNDPEEYMVSDGKGGIPTFRCFRDVGTGGFEGYLKYRLGSGARKFRLVEEPQGDAGLFVDGKRLYVHSEASETPTKYLIFSNGTLEEKEIDIPSLPGEVEEESGRCDSEAQGHVVMSFLRSLRPQHHSQFLYFYVSNVDTIYGQVLASFIDGRMVFHTVTSPLCLNFNELLSDTTRLSAVSRVPYFPHTNFTISHGWHKIYESRTYQPGWTYPSKFLLEVLGLVLLEERMVFYSAQDCSLQVMQIMDLIRPFRWPHIVCLPLLSGMEEILESPLPFIVCTNRRRRMEGVALVDLDRLKVHGARKAAPLLGSRIRRMAAKDDLEGVRGCMELIASEILLWRVYLIRKHGSRVVTKMPDNPSEFLGKTHEFYNGFFKTRMFLIFVTQERDHLCRYLVETGRDYSVILLPHGHLDWGMEARSLKLWIELFDGDMGPVVEYLSKNGLLEGVADIVFKSLSYREEYDKIDKIITRVSPAREAYMGINLISKMPRIAFKNLYSFKVYHLGACDCKALALCSSRYRRGPEGEKSQDLLQTRKEVRRLLGEMDQKMFDPKRERCRCTARSSAVLVAGPEYVFLSFLLVPENISMVLKHCGSKDLLERHPQAYWSIVAYFSYFNLPLGQDPGFGAEVDIVIDDSFLESRADGRPEFYYFDL